MGSLALYGIFSLKVILFDGQPKIGLAVLSVALLLMFVLELAYPHDEKDDWLDEDPGINEDEDIVELKLTGNERDERKGKH